MNTRRKTFLLLFLIGLLTVCAHAQAVSTLQGKVVGVADGDTISLLDAGNKQYRIRSNGIDAPESKQDFGGQSKQNLANLVFMRQVTIEYRKLLHKKLNYKICRFIICRKENSRWQDAKCAATTTIYRLKSSRLASRTRLTASSARFIGSRPCAIIADVASSGTV